MDQQVITDVIKQANKYTDEYLSRAKVIAKANKLWPTASLLIGIMDKLIYFENVLLLAKQKQEEAKLRDQEDLEDSGLNLHIKDDNDEVDTGEV